MFEVVVFLLFLTYMAGLISGIIFAHRVWESNVE